MTHPWKIEPGAAMADYPKSDSQKNMQNMTPEQTQLYFYLTMADVDPANWKPFEPKDGVKLPFYADVLWRRIQGMELPITVTTAVLFAPQALCDRVAGAVVYLVDLLQRFEGRPLITMKDVADLYPWGFYKEEVLHSIVDDYMKARVHPWSPVYIMKQ